MQQVHLLFTSHHKVFSNFVSLDDIMDDKDSIELVYSDKWYQAIRQNEISYISKTLNEADLEIKQHLVNARFGRFAPEEVERNVKKFNLKALHNVQITIAWHFVLTLGSFESINAFLKHGVDVCAMDNKKQNGLHYLVLLSHLDPNLEGKMKKHYKHLVAKLGKEELKAMLMQENIQGLRPLELAMNVGTLGIFEGRLFYICIHSKT